MKACATVKESLEVGLRLGSTAYEGNEYFLRIDGDTTWMCYREPRVISAGQTFINDMTLTVYFQLVCALVDDEWRPEQALIRRELTDRHAALQQFEECRASCHPDLTALAIPTAFLSRPLPERFLASEVHCESEWQFGPENSDPIVERLHRLLASSFACRKLPTLQQVAKMVDVGEATLKRQLASAGMSYRGLLDRLRFMEARKLLSVPEMSVKDIALEIGYADTSNFVRAFRRMTGVPPEVYRRQQLLGALRAVHK
jgi:AraC-like DNA-binding protein